MVFMVVRVVAPRWPIHRAMLSTLTISCLCEISQTYHAPWLDAIRSYRLGVILLGDCFMWSDLVCYAVGVLGGSLMEWAVQQAAAMRRSRIASP
jgi:hypothetical protein